MSNIKRNSGNNRMPLGVLIVVLIIVLGAAILVLLRTGVFGTQEDDNDALAVISEEPSTKQSNDTAGVLQPTTSATVSDSPSPTADETQKPGVADEPSGQDSAETEATGDIEERNDDEPLRGIVVCIDPGHQLRGDSSQEAIAPGARETKPKVSTGTSGSYTGVPEYVLNLEVSLVLREKLENLGALVIMTRVTHDVNISNSERAMLANDYCCDMVIRIHADASSDSGVRGYSIMVPGSRYTPDIVPDSVRMAEILDSVLLGYVEIPSRGLITTHELTGFNWLVVPGILLEMGFMTNRADDEIMQTPEFVDNVTDAIAQALVQYITS